MDKRLPIGGYFGLDLPRKGKLHPFGTRLNTARNCLRVVLENSPNLRVYIPHFCCHAVRQSALMAGKEVVAYAINHDFEIESPFLIHPDDIVIYVNYFGIKDEYCAEIASRFPNLIIDNAQALYSQIEGTLATVYSPRKFVGVADGGILISRSLPQTQDCEEDALRLLNHLIRRISCEPEDAYSCFLEAERAIETLPPRGMSGFSSMVLDAMDHAFISESRIANAGTAHDVLNDLNQLDLTQGLLNPPLAYPLFLSEKGRGLRHHLLKKRIFLPTFWPELLVDPKIPEFEKKLALDLLPVPIDQRYSPALVKEYCETIRKEILTC